MEWHPTFMGWKTVKMTLPEQIYRFSITPIKIPMALYEEIFKIYPKIHINFQGTQKSQGSFGKEEQSWKSHTFYFKCIVKTKL